ncbi:MAG TPA: class I SAM-dependent methyltransferase [Acidobacteriota bacterium]|nr:class I SAM-dependent methyltransferase [Acidobacteriota bacterium]HQO20270.1 class I SAM-dependent methyltransferase [Acidobacteriota bacterium]HQQ47544.1 class I SAM-dependent methyltransferase [Acidobacteriota bacterium]
MISSNSFQFDRLKCLRQWLYREVKIAKYSSVLDIGAGDLRISAEIADHIKHKVHALDMVKPPVVPNNVVFVKGKAEKLLSDREKFDVITASFFYFWIKDLPSLLGKAKKVLKKDGILMFLSEPQFSERVDTPDSGLNSEFKKGLKKMGANPNIEKALKESLAKAGFKATFFRTNEKVVIERKDEIMEEIEFLFRNGAINQKQRVLITKKELSYESKEVFVPIVYGYATPN